MLINIILMLINPKPGTSWKNASLSIGKSLSAVAVLKENWQTFLPKFIARKYETSWFYELHLSQQKFMILDHISMEAVKPLKFTNKDYFFHADSGKFCNFRKEQLIKLTSKLYFHFVEINRQNRRRKTVKYTKTRKWAQWALFSR